MPKCPKCGSENVERLGGGVGFWAKFDGDNFRAIIKI